MNAPPLCLTTLLTFVLLGTVLSAQSSPYHFSARAQAPWGKGRILNQEHKNVWPPILFSYLPFQNAPGPRSSSVDQEDPDSPLNDSVNNLDPHGKPDTPPSREAHQSGIRFDRCIDTDMCLFIIPGENNQRARRMLVELFGTEIPRLRKSCEQERVLATEALDLLQQLLSEATQIDVYDHYKVGRTHLARVVADGQDVSELLISQGLAVLKGHGHKDWCTD